MGYNKLLKGSAFRVLDPFGGTGTVAVMANRTGRRFIHVDISRKYCQIAEKRPAELPP